MSVSVDFTYVEEAGTLRQLMLHTITVAGEELRLLDSLPSTVASNSWVDKNVDWISCNPSAWQRVDFYWEM